MREYTFAVSELEGWIDEVGGSDAVEDRSIESIKTLIIQARELAKQVPTVLVVDDEESILDLFRTLLEAQGFRGIFETDVKTAVKHCHMGGVDLIICDLLMPNIDGFTFIRSVRRISHTKETPIMVYSAADPRQAIVQLKDAKIDAYVQKPGDTTILRDKIAGLLEHWEDSLQD